jgi:hypothetical protein
MVKSLSQGTSFLWKLKKKRNIFLSTKYLFYKIDQSSKMDPQNPSSIPLLLPSSTPTPKNVADHWCSLENSPLTCPYCPPLSPPIPSLPPLKPPNSLHFFSLSETLTISSSTPYPPSPILAFTTRCINSVAFGRGRNLVPVRCISSISSSAAPNQQHTAVGWNEPVTCSELGDGGKGTNIEEDARQSIPVRAFLFSTRF